MYNFGYPCYGCKLNRVRSIGSYCTKCKMSEEYGELFDRAAELKKEISVVQISAGDTRSKKGVWDSERNPNQLWDKLMHEWEGRRK